MKFITLLKLFIMCSLFFESCSDDGVGRDIVWLNCNDLPSNINQGQSTDIEVSFRRNDAKYKYIWMGILGQNYRTEAISIEDVNVNNEVHTKTIQWNIGFDVKLHSGFYTLYVAMGVDENDPAPVRAYSLDSDFKQAECQYITAIGNPSIINVDLNYVTSTPINYKIMQDKTFDIEYTMKVTGGPPTGCWARAFFEVKIPDGTGDYIKLNSNYYVYYVQNDFHVENFKLNWGGGIIDWDGNFELSTIVKIYDTWPSQSNNYQTAQEIGNTFTFPYEKPTIILKPPTTPQIETLDIEYDQQWDQNLFEFILASDDGQTGESDLINSAYTPLEKQLVFHKSDHNLQKRFFDIIDGLEDIKTLINENHDNQNYIYLCSVQGLTTPLGITPIGFAPRVELPDGSMVNIGVLISYGGISSSKEPYIDAILGDFYLERVATLTVCHEIGHYLDQLETHGHDVHSENDKYCLMHSLPIWTNSGSHFYSTYQSSFFCKKHAEYLKLFNKFNRRLQ